MTSSPLDHVAELAACLAAAGLDALELRGPDGHVRLVRGGDGTVTPAPVAAQGAAAAEPGAEVVASPGVGHFLSVHPLRSEPLAEPDAPVSAGEVVGLLRIGALLLPVTAPRDGIVLRVVAEEGALVGYGDPLVELWPES